MNYFTTEPYSTFLGDSMTSRFILINLSILVATVAFLGFPPQTAQGSVIVLSDGTFNDSSWSATVISSYGGATYADGQLATGGNPGYYRLMTHSMPANSQISTFNEFLGGTYTPVVCKYTDQQTAVMFLGIMWSLIIAGSVLKIFFTGRYDKLSTAIYVLLGWMVVFIIKPIMANMPLEVFWWIFGGGIAYTFGVIFYKWHKLTFQHSIWHLFVLAGTLLQYVAVYKCVTP